MSRTVDITQELKDSLRKFHFARRDNNAAFIAKVNKQKLIIEEVEQLTDVSIEELAEELPGASPRFVVLAYAFTHEDRRKSYPLILINWVPSGSETAMLTLHASAFIPFQSIVEANKVIEIREGAEGLSKAAIDSVISRV